MANRNTLALKALPQFQSWLADNGWQVQEPKGKWEVLRAVKQGRKNPLIVYKRLATNSGEQIIHLSVLDRDMGVVRQFLDFKRSITKTERKILFRGFHPDKNGNETITLTGEKIRGEWVSGSLLEYRPLFADVDKVERTIVYNNGGSFCYDKVIPETVGQWVITNRYHKDIFEGDYVAFYGDYIHTGVVEWNESNAQFVVVDEDGDWDLIDIDWEVIGNKWESEVTE